MGKRSSEKAAAMVAVAGADGEMDASKVPSAPIDTSKWPLLLKASSQLAISIMTHLILEL